MVTSVVMLKRKDTPYCFSHNQNTKTEEILKKIFNLF